MKCLDFRFPARVSLAFIAALALMLSSCGGSGDSGITSALLNTSASTQAATQELGDAFAATLTGEQEVPPRQSTAQGSGSIVVNAATRQMIATLTTNGVAGTAAHIHQAQPGANGPIIFPLTETAAGSGVWVARATLTEAEYNTLRSGGFYFNVHSATFPDGEIRGQITAALSGSIKGSTPVDTAAVDSTGLIATSFISALRGSREVPPTPSTAQGSGTVVLHPGTRQLNAAVATTGIAGTAAHIHEGAAGVNGPIVIPLSETSAGSGIWHARATLTETQYNLLQAGKMYFNVHSTAFPDGEIRGQILPHRQLPASVTGPRATTTIGAVTPMSTSTGIDTGTTDALTGTSGMGIGTSTDNARLATGY